MKYYAQVKVLVIALLFTAGLSFVSAWTGPTATPPGNNVPAPINVGTSAQVKNGDLSVNNFLSTGNAQVTGNFEANTLLPGGMAYDGAGCSNYANGTLARSADGVGTTLSCRNGTWRGTHFYSQSTLFNFSDDGVSQGQTTGYHDICSVVGVYQNGNNGWITLQPSNMRADGKMNYTVYSTCAAQGCGSGSLQIEVQCLDF